MKRVKAAVIGFILLLAGMALTAEKAGAEENDCISCHGKSTPGIVAQWKDSKHFGAGVVCLDCHQVDIKDADAFEHHGKTIATIVSPGDCSQCHEKEAKEFSASHHANAATFIGSLDNILGVAAEGLPAAINGCQQCHGSTVTMLAKGKLNQAAWPNTGIGRINPDGTKGSCSACHYRHGFSVSQARQPENCGKCHLGPDHPQIEIYKESKHGVLFEANRGKMNIESEKWVPGKDYSAAPTCSSCHMGATPTQASTHEVGARISWTLRPAISVKQENWEKKRESMKDVCAQCHAKEFSGNFYSQFDSVVELYNNKFAAPAKEIMDELYQDNLLTGTPFDETIEWTYYELWHHEGRRARHGAAMMGPDYTQWHGFYEVAKHFYNEFIPEAEALKKGVTAKAMASGYHKWKKGLSKKEMKSTLDFYKERYGQ